MTRNRIVAFAGLCAITVLGLSAPIRAEKPFDRSRASVQGLLGGMDLPLSPLPDMPAVLADIPAPPAGIQLPAPAPEDLISEVSEAVLEQLQAIDRRTALRGQDYFAGHPDSPKLELAFHDPAASHGPPEPCPVIVGDRELLCKNGAELNRWYPRLGPIRIYRTTYSPAQGETHPPLIAVELQLDRGFYKSLFQDAIKAYGPAYFQDRKAAAGRLALLLAPRAAAELELSRLLDQREVPDGIRVDEIEELRLLWEAAALRGQLSLQEAMLSAPSFRLLPSEQNYLARQFGEDSRQAVLAPRGYIFSDQAREDWQKLSEESRRSIPLLALRNGASDEQLIKESEDLARQLRQNLKNDPIKPDPPLLLRLLRAERAQEYLAKPGAMARLREALKTEHAAATSFPYISDSAKNSWFCHATIAAAIAAAKELDLNGAESLLGDAQLFVKRRGLSYDVAAVRESLKPYLAMARGKSLLESGDSKEGEEGVKIFSSIGPAAKEAIPALEKVLVDFRLPYVARANAAMILGRIGPEAVPALMDGLQANVDDGSALTIEQALADNAPASIPALAAAAASSPKPALERRVVEICGKIGAPAAPILIRLLKSRTNWDIHCMAAERLGSIKPPPPGAISVLLETLQDKNLMVRETAIDSLTAYGPEARQALPALRQLRAQGGSGEWLWYIDRAIRTILGGS